MINNFKRLTRLVILLTALFAKSSYAQISFNIKNEDTPKTKILFLGFDSTNYNLKSDIADITQIIKRNLDTTDLFEIVKYGGQLSTTTQNQNDKNKKQTAETEDQNLATESLPDFAKYQKLDIGAILIADFGYGANGNLEIRVRMWDILDERQLFGKYYAASKDNYKKMANLISDEIFKSITGEKIGHFNSKILYVAESGSVLRRTKKIISIDFDGSTRRVVTDGRDLVLTPIFSKKNDEILLLRYRNNRPQITSLNLDSLRFSRVGGFEGTTYGATTHPIDPNIILISAIQNGNSDIYEVNLAANSAKRLTKNPGIDTTPYYSPDGNYIIFVSDRDGSQKLYLMNSDGDNVRKISYNSGSYSKPVWSPDGKLIAFTKLLNGRFFIGLMSPNGRNEKLITSGYMVEGARWSPNGRYLIYSRKQGPYGKDSIPRLCIIDIVTGYERQVPTPENEGATDPDWALK